MAFVSITHSLTNATISDATKVNTNFNDITDGLSIGNKDIKVRNADIVSATVSLFVHTGGTAGFFGATPVDQATAITSPSGGTTVDTECRAAVGRVLTILSDLGFSAT